jgi:hypothetical protein
LETLEKIVEAFGGEPLELFRLGSAPDAAARRGTIDDHLSLVSRKTTEEIYLLNKIMKEIITAMDMKR